MTYKGQPITLTEREYAEALRYSPTLSPKNAQIVWQVCVNQQRQTDVARQHGMSRTRVRQVCCKVAERYRERSVLPLHKEEAVIF